VKYSCILAVAVALTIAFSSGRATADEKREFFEKKIRPVLVKHCYQCHSADAKELGGKLRVDSRDGMLTGGESGPVLLAGQPEESLIIQALRFDGLEMPPEAPLPPAVINDFVRWVEMGAADPREPPKNQDHAEQPTEAWDTDALWSFLPRRRPAVPQVNDSQWPRNTIDHFVLARIEQSGLELTRDADARTLVRRLYYDLIGLAPSQVQIETFAEAFDRDRDDATRRLVDELLESPQFGVRWGRHWLDVARYGESNGDDGLGRNATFPNAWRYRDYVIDSLNRDVPYDRFLAEQITGDLLPAETADQRNRQLIATGFLAIGSKPAAAMNSNFAMDVVDDQINAVCTTVLGLSVACARCHDHKHDPIPTRDYYALAGIFRSTETLYGASANEKLTAPPTPLHELRSHFEEAQQRPDRTPTPNFSDGYSTAIDELKPLIHETLTSTPKALTATAAINYSTDTFAAVRDARLTGSFSEPAASYSLSFWFRNTLSNNKRPITAYLFSRAKLDDPSLPGDHLGIGGTHDKARTGKLFIFNGNEKKRSIVGSTVIPPNSWNHIVLIRDAQRVKVFLNGQLEIEDDLDATFGSSATFCFADRSDNFAPLTGNVGEIALFAHALNDEQASRLHTASGQPLGFHTLPPLGFAMGVREGAKPEDCKIHINGEGNKLGPVVPRGILTAYRDTSAADPDLAQIAIANDVSGRAALVNWLTRPDHPQTSRVIVNRIWLHLFGRGIVTTPDDFGVYGARPTHPDLLDHLANQFVEDGWSIKRMIRRVVLTRTYSLDSSAAETALQKDPDNAWLARHHRKRLDAESLRDSMLQASGAIDLSPGVGSAIDDVDMLINWPPGEATDLHRESHHRSIYLCMLRHAPPKELIAFDLPDGVEIRGQRETTTLPTQSLFLLNSEFVVQQSRKLAERVLEDTTLSDRDLVKQIFSDTLRRFPDEAEFARSLDLIRSSQAQLSEIVSTKTECRLQAWASLAQALMTTNEFRYID